VKLPTPPHEMTPTLLDERISALEAKVEEQETRIKELERRIQNLSDTVCERDPMDE